MRRAIFLIAFSLSVLGHATPAATQSSGRPVIPEFWDTRERIAGANLESVARLRFLTTLDFPPFSYLDRDGRLSGFNIDLARAICDELKLLEKCQIQAVPLTEIPGMIGRGEGDAALAGIPVSAETRRSYRFSRPYLVLPVRFAAGKASDLEGQPTIDVSGRRVGVISGSLFEDTLRNYFPNAKAVIYSQERWMYDDLKAGKLDAIFGDGLRISFWIAGSHSGNCCSLVGEPYYPARGNGSEFAIAVSPRLPGLPDALNLALRELQSEGRFAEIVLRYFPGGPY